MNDQSTQQELWQVMYDAHKSGKTEMPLSYFVGFSHALYLTGVISPAAWHRVQDFTGGGDSLPD
jgi:hypothetical protein